MKTFSALACTLLLATVPCRADALPGQPIEEALQPAIDHGWPMKVETFRKAGSWICPQVAPVHVKPVGLLLMEGYSPEVSEKGVILSERTSRAVQIREGQTEEDALTEWTAFLEKFYGEDVADEILDSRAVHSFEERKVQKGNIERARTAVIKGKQYCYRVTIFTSVPEDYGDDLPVGSFLQCAVSVWPLSEYKKALTTRSPDKHVLPFRWPLQ